MTRNFLRTSDWSRSELQSLIESALRFKHGDDQARMLEGRSIALVFFNPSLRTRASMQVGIFELGGNAVVLEPGGTSWTLEHGDGMVMDGDKTEHVAEFVRVVGRYCSAIGVRTFAALQNWEEERQDPVLSAFARYADVPIINLESAMHHPCQALADMMTIREKLGSGRKKVSNDIHAAFEGVQVVYAKSWGASQFYGMNEKDVAERAQYRRDWIVDAQKMARTSDGIFMHCLPVRRNVIVTDGVIDSPASVVIDEAENRLHVQKAVLRELLGEGN